MLINTDNKIYHLIRSLRPRQWIKNTSLFAAIFFAGSVFDPTVVGKVIISVIIFSCLASAAYLINDIIDAPKDKLHPIKKNRPIASGKLSEKTAFATALFLIAITLPMAILYINLYFFIICGSYLILQFLYSTKIRNIIILDAIAVALGFIFRVFAGAFAAEVSISSWLVLSTIGLSLLLAFGKRRSEKTILSAQNIALKTRKTLRHYPDTLLDAMISMSSAYTLISYSIFSFQTESLGEHYLSKFLPSSLAAPKWMMLTIPVVIYGVARYLYVIYEKKDAESPERVLLSDKPLLLSILLWITAIFFLVYILGVSI